MFLVRKSPGILGASSMMCYSMPHKTNGINCPLTTSRDISHRSYVIQTVNGVLNRDAGNKDL